jgi:uncharacterized protein YyaL (SSP411 family)
MEHESFENEEIARLMNQNFVCIKVDREERPDIDTIYMSAIQMMTGHGGWPLTAFLTPDLKPFYGGTYYPPVDRHGMPGFPRILLAIADSYKNRRAEILSSANVVTEELNKMSRIHGSGEMLTTEAIEYAYSSMAGSFDRVNGGFGGAPKFPPSMSLMFLLRQHARTNSPAPMDMVELTLEKMAGGGMYDQLGGGFHRYSVDAEWLVPHFEKMLYDNALLARTYLYAYQATRRPLYRRIAEETLDYVIRDMTDPSGAFFSSEDADSEGEEGKFYTWTRSEIFERLGRDEAELFCQHFGVTEPGDFEHGTNILHVSKPLADIAQDRKIDLSKLESTIKSARARLFAVREERVRPGRDDKTLTAWNALMLIAFAEAANILGRDDYRQIAIRNGDFLIGQMIQNGRLLRTYKEGRARLNGYVEDYAYLVEALLALYEATFDIKYFDQARALAATMIEQFWDESETGFFFTSADHEQLITRTKDYYDNAIPSGNSVAALALLKLWRLTNDNQYQRPALSVLRAMQQTISRYPSAFGYLLCALDFYLSESKEIAIVGQPESHEVRSLVQEIYGRFLPNKVVALAEPGDSGPSGAIALLQGKTAINGKATAYVCRDYMCLSPATTPEELSAQLGS